MSRPTILRAGRPALVALTALSLAAGVAAVTAVTALQASASLSDVWGGSASSKTVDNSPAPPPLSGVGGIGGVENAGQPPVTDSNGSTERSPNASETPSAGQPDGNLGDGRPLPFKEATAVHRANGFVLVTEVPMGFAPAATASANAGKVQGVSEFRWTNGAGKEFVFAALVRPGGRTDHVFVLRPGAMTGLAVRGHAAEYLQGDGGEPSRLVWFDGSTEYQITSDEPGLTMADFLRMAESAR